MTHETTMNYKLTDPRCWTRVVIGLFVMLAFVLVSASLGWAAFGYPADHTPLQWWRQPMDTLCLAIAGAAIGGVGLGLLWIVGAFAYAIGDAIIARWQKIGGRSNA